MKFYIGKRSCGCIVAGHTDTPDTDRKLLARWIASWMKDGLTVEHIEAEEVRLSMSPCEHERPDAHGPLFARTGVLLALFFCLIGTAHAGEGDVFDLPPILINGAFTGQLTWPMSGTNYTMTVNLNLTEGSPLAPNTITGSGSLPWQSDNSVCIYGRNPAAPCSGILYSIPPNPTCGNQSGLYVCEDVGVQNYTCDVNMSGSFTVTSSATRLGFFPALYQVTVTPTPNGVHPCPGWPPGSSFNLTATEDCSDTDFGVCNEDYGLVGTFGGASTSGTLSLAGE